MKEVSKGTWKLVDLEIKYNFLLSSCKLYNVIHNQGLTNETLYEGIDERSLLRDYHLGAVFLYNQKTYKVTRILHSKNEICALPVKADYTTRSQIFDSFHVLDVVKENTIHDLVKRGRGQVEINRHLFGYKKVYLASKKCTKRQLKL
jgi:DEAD/DEAH box helicase domain-containing protein